MRHVVRRRLATAAVLAASAAIGISGAASAQIKPSEATTVTQTVDATTITIAYSRPVARGRALFGSLVPWDIHWTGANNGTTLEASRDVRINGVDVPAGRYAIWILPHEGPRWTVTLDRDADVWHTEHPDSTAAQIHFAAFPEAGPHAELYTWSFPFVSGDAAVARMQWGTTSLPLRIIVQPTQGVVADAAERRAVAGVYDLALTGPAGWPASGRLAVTDENGVLRGRLPFPLDPSLLPEAPIFDLVRAGSHRFNAGVIRDGRLLDVVVGVTFEFDVAEDADRATAVRLRAPDGRLLGVGSPVPER